MPLCCYPCPRHDSLPFYNIYMNQIDAKCLSKGYLFKICMCDFVQNFTFCGYIGKYIVKVEAPSSENIGLILNKILAQFRIK